MKGIETSAVLYKGIEIAHDRARSWIERRQKDRRIKSGKLELRDIIVTTPDRNPPHMDWETVYSPELTRKSLISNIDGFVENERMDVNRENKGQRYVFDTLLKEEEVRDWLYRKWSFADFPKSFRNADLNIRWVGQEQDLTKAKVGDLTHSSVTRQVVLQIKPKDKSLVREASYDFKFNSNGDTLTPYGTAFDFTDPFMRAQALDPKDYRMAERPRKIGQEQMILLNEILLLAIHKRKSK